MVNTPPRSPDHYMAKGRGKGKHYSHAAITHEEYPFTFPPLSIARYLFIQLSGTGRRGKNENAQVLLKLEYSFTDYDTWDFVVRQYTPILICHLEQKHGHVCFANGLYRQSLIQLVSDWVLDTHCQIDSFQCLAQLTPARVEKARSVHLQLGASPHVIRWYIVCLSPQSHTSVWESFHIFIIARQRPFCTLSRFKLLQVYRWPNVHLGLSLCRATQLIVHQGRYTPLPTMWYLFWGVKCFCWIKKDVSEWKHVVGRALAMEWVYRVIFLDASICIAGNLSEGLSPPVHTSRVLW